MKNIEKINYIADHYGFISQREMLIEECAELIQAAQKLKRKRASDDVKGEEEATAHFVEELADVSIMVEQMKYLLPPFLHNCYDDTVTQKLDRQLERIEHSKELEVENYARWRKGVNA